MHGNLACELEAFDDGQAARYSVVCDAVREAAMEARPIPGGFAITFPSRPEVVMLLAEFMTLERRCCRFLDLGVEAPAGSDRVELRMSGGPGVQEFLAAQLGV